MKKVRVQYDVVLKFTAFVEVEGDFVNEDDRSIDLKAEQAVRNMDVRDMAFEDEEYEIIDIVEVKE